MFDSSTAKTLLGVGALAGAVMAVAEVWPVIGWETITATKTWRSDHIVNRHVPYETRTECYFVKGAKDQLERAYSRLPDDLSDESRMIYDQQLGDYRKKYDKLDCASIW